MRHCGEMYGHGVRDSGSAIALMSARLWLARHKYTLSADHSLACGNIPYNSPKPSLSLSNAHYPWLQDAAQFQHGEHLAPQCPELMTSLEQMPQYFAIAAVPELQDTLLHK